MENQKVQDLGKTEDNDDSSSSEIEQKPKQVKPKKILSEKQKETLAKGREKRDSLRREIIEKKKLEDEEKKKQLENKIVKKAITIKKKQIKMEKVLELSEDADSEDDRPPPIRRIARPKAPPNTPVIRPVAPPAPQAPKFIFL